VEYEQSNGFFYQTCVSVAEYFRSSKTDLLRGAVSISPVLLLRYAQIEQTNAQLKWKFLVNRRI